MQVAFQTENVYEKSLNVASKGVHSAGMLNNSVNFNGNIFLNIFFIFYFFLNNLFKSIIKLLITI